ncbi:NADH-quinone oxidoreductase subunit J [Luteipulveratus sp. YIM 133132]|uniref:NADH-quinone oxidoreductase subunit J family protein n=1 Tax=Luteipulveratus flavus TaxID=3031728 RepID=UPI0023B0F8BB|nr:NADH-quinone oxidoreductase subunit J [Luteipulveratus sp. YIM 133132]MDE9365138.1 NADH-quinone oxidoreductase subunit J [Luteipulveratus sp. YIM 133132]
MTTHDVLFLLVGLITGASAVLSVTTKHLVHAALWLVVSLGALSGCYLVLGAELVALVQLLVYVGAVVVLVLFALMLTHAPIGRSTAHDGSVTQRVAALIAGAATAALLAATLISAFGGEVDVQGGSTGLLAQRLFGTWVWPFELLSLLLLIALVAALALARLATSPGDAVDAVATAPPEREPVASRTETS